VAFHSNAAGRRPGGYPSASIDSDEHSQRGFTALDSVTTRSNNSKTQILEVGFQYFPYSVLPVYST
jgi:hypothetical protein